MTGASDDRESEANIGPNGDTAGGLPMNDPEFNRHPQSGYRMLRDSGPVVTPVSYTHLTLPTIYSV